MSSTHSTHSIADHFNDFPLPAILVQGDHWQWAGHNTAFQSELQLIQLPEAGRAIDDILRPKDANLTLSQIPAGQWTGGIWQADASSAPILLVFQVLPQDTQWIDQWAPDNHKVVIILSNENLVHQVTHPSIEQIAQRHRDFVSVVSHEFRTPLTSIKGYADTLLRYSANLDAEKQTKFIQTIKDQADRLTRMVENLLTVSKLGEETIQLEFRSIPSASLIQRVSENILAKGTQDKLYANREVHCDLPEKLPAWWGDPDKVEQVVTNLIDNAVKYSFEHSTIRVTAQEGDNQQLVLSVTNAGAGIPKEQIPSIFKRFSRADDPLTRQVEGTGLGLYITKSLVEAMNGTITVDSIQNEETTFHLTLPIATSERQQAYNKSRGVDEAFMMEG